MLQKRSRPFLNPRTVLPALLAGLLWSIGQLGWFMANDSLSQAVSFPIIGTLPGMVAALWSVFYFREIQGKRDLTLLGLALFSTCTGAVLVGLSKMMKS